jgi:hypothetical protein
LLFESTNTDAQGSVVNGAASLVGWVKECAGGVGEVANVAWLGAMEAVFKVMGDELALGNQFFFKCDFFF